MARLAAVLVLATLAVAPAARAQSPGGHLDVLSVADVDSLDPGYWYYQYDYMALGQTTQRWLYAWEPGKTTPTPDIADVAYALTRDLMPRTGNGYASAYYSVIKGAGAVLRGRTQKLAGVEAPDATTLVLHLIRPSGAISTAQALALPGTIPVPGDYAR